MVIKSRALALLMSGILTLAMSLCAIQASTDQEAAERVMANLHAALPPGPIGIEARMTTRARNGEQTAESEIEIVYAHTNGGFSVELTLYDAFGSLLEKVAVSGIGSDKTRYEYWKGEDLVPAEMPPLGNRIGASEFRWMDLTLSFLWWKGGQVAGFDSLKGRDCYIVDIRAPEDIEEVAGVELWIDSEMYALLRARFYDDERETLKRFDVKSFSKSGELWMAKDIDMRSHPSQRRTRLRVRKVSAQERDG